MTDRISEGYDVGPDPLWSASDGLLRTLASKLTKSDLAYQRIRQGIVVGRYAPDSLLDQEELASQLGLSTTPVREALRRLESERLVVRRAHRDTVVAPVSLDALEDVYAVRLALDPLAASLAATHASPEARAAMLHLALEHPSGLNPERLLHRNRMLHRAIYTSCHNGVLATTLDSLWDMCDRYRLITLHHSANVQTAQEEHEAIVRAVIDERPGEAAELMRHHVAESLGRMRDDAGRAKAPAPIEGPPCT